MTQVGPPLHDTSSGSSTAGKSQPNVPYLATRIQAEWNSRGRERAWWGFSLRAISIAFMELDFANVGMSRSRSASVRKAFGRYLLRSCIWCPQLQSSYNGGGRVSIRIFRSESKGNLTTRVRNSAGQLSFKPISLLSRTARRVKKASTRIDYTHHPTLTQHE